MVSLIRFLFSMMSSTLRTRASLQLEVAALRHQLSVYKDAGRRPRITPADRLLWSLIATLWSGWRRSLCFVQPRTVVAWQQKRFRDYWRRLSQSGKPGRPTISPELRNLIRRMWEANPCWGSPRIVGELGKLDIHVAKSTVEKYKPRPNTPSSPSWRTFLDQHDKDLVSVDFFVVPTVKFRVLFVFIVLAHDRRRVIHFNVTEHPTARWTAQQIVEAFPWDSTPRFLIRDRDRIYGDTFQRRIQSLNIEEVVIAPRSPWQNPYAERVIGSIRRELLNHVVALNERHLKRLLLGYLDYYHHWRTHRSLEMDAPNGRCIKKPASSGQVVELPTVQGLHHYYLPDAA